MSQQSTSALLDWDAAPFLKKVTDVAPGVIYIFNQHTQSNEYSNQSLGETLGYSDAEVMEMGADLMPRLCHPEDLPAVGAHFERLKTLQDGEIARVEYRIRHKNDRWVWLLSHDTVFERAPDGSVLRHIGIASDITQQKEAEVRAVAERLKATTINDELQAFSYSMSHDMKAPSNTLNLLLTELLETHEASLDEDAAELVRMALVTAKRMGSLVDDVLHYTRVIGQDLVLQPVDMNEVMAGILQDLHSLIRETGADVAVPNLPLVRADPMQMRLFFQNLIENAIKFHAPDTPPHVKILTEQEPEIKTCTLSVQDDGIGIHPSKHSQIFTIFKRLNNAMDFSGTGLGLAICRRIAANHDSKITLVSAPGEGSTFGIDLELA